MKPSFLDTKQSTCHWLRCAGYFSGKVHSGEAWIAIADGKIAAIRHEAPEGQQNGVSGGEDSYYAAPLLADTHGHCYMEPWPLEPKLRDKPGSKVFEDEVKDAIGRVDRAFQNGVGFIRDMGDPYGINLEVKRRLAARGTPAPELQAPGPAFHRPKKYGRYLGVKRETVADIKQSIGEFHECRAIDYVKLVATGIVDFAQKRMNQSPQFTADELRDVVDYAHELGYKVAAHCSGDDGLDLCIEAGVDFIEHAYFVTRAQVERMTERGLAWTPTFAPVHAQGANDACGWSDEARERIEEILSEHASMLAYARQCGTQVLAGTDAGSPGVELGLGLRIELERMAHAGYTATELLKIATATNAAACGAHRYCAHIEVGAPASFALYEKAPWENITNLNSLCRVIADGQTVVSP